MAVHDGFLPHINPEEREEGCLKKSNLTWAQPLQALEVKPWDSALVDGSCMPRLKVNGKHAAASRGWHSTTNGEQDETHSETTSTLTHHRGSRRRPVHRPRPQTPHHRGRGLQTSPLNSIESRRRCITNQLPVAGTVRQRGDLEQVKLIVRRMHIFKLDGISWNNSLSLPSVLTQPSVLSIAIVSSSTTQTIRSSSYLLQSAFRQATAQAV